MCNRVFSWVLSCMAALAFIGGLVTAAPKPMYDAAPGSLAREYTSISEMAEESPLVVEVKVLTDPFTITHEGLLFAKNRVKVVRELKGPGGLSEITVLDNGGLYHGQEYAMGGMPLLHAGDRYLLFLYKYQGPITDEDAYMISGVWQGKVKIGWGGGLEYVGPSVETLELQKDIRRNRIDTVQERIRER